MSHQQQQQQQQQQHEHHLLIDDEGEAFARAVFCRFLRQATICRDVDDVIEHMHIVNDNSRTFDIRLGGDARVPVSRELILALAAKKKELMALCESKLRTPRSMSGDSSHAMRGTATVGASGSGGLGLSSSLQHYQEQNGGGGGGGGGGSPPMQDTNVHSTAHRAVVFPPPAALAAMQSAAMAAGSKLVPVPVGRGGDGDNAGNGGGGVSVMVTAAGLTSEGGVAALGSLPPATVVRHQHGKVVAAAVAAASAAASAVPAVVPKPAVVAAGSGQGGGADGATGVGSDGGGGRPVKEKQRAPGEQQLSAPPPAAVNSSAATAPALVPAAASASATAAAGWSQAPATPDSAGPTTLFVRKVDTKVDRDAIIKHFSSFGTVLSVSLNPTRGYAFVDMDSHESVLRAVSTSEHTVGRKSLQVEIKKEPPARSKTGAGSRNGGR
ncbi:unnamed protein product [Pylaiella littoralis]